MADLAKRPTLGLPNKIMPEPEPSRDEGEKTEPPGEMVTYLPGEGDPAKVKWRGVEFMANVPVRLADAAHIEAARGNRFYRVGEGVAADNPNLPPSDAKTYRAHVVSWLKGVETVEGLVKAWASDRLLRGRCEVGEDDIKYLGTLVEPRLRQMRMAEGMSDQQVANIWVKYGVLELPWRS